MLSYKNIVILMITLCLCGSLLGCSSDTTPVSNISTEEETLKQICFWGYGEISKEVMNGEYFQEANDYNFVDVNTRIQPQIVNDKAPWNYVDLSECSWKVFNESTGEQIGEYVFDGWYYDEDYSKECLKGTVIKESTDLYAKWNYVEQ